jgi:hypothetical protein
MTLSPRTLVSALKRGVVSGAELVGETIGTYVGAGLIGLLVPETSGASLFMTPPVTVGLAEIGGYTFGHLASAMEEEYDDVNKFWSR